MASSIVRSPSALEPLNSVVATEGRIRSNSAADGERGPLKTLFQDIRERTRSHSVSAPTDVARIQSSLPGQSRLSPLSPLGSTGRAKVDTTASDLLQVEVSRLLKKHKMLVTHLNEVLSKMGEREKDTPGGVGVKNEELSKRLEKEIKSLDEKIWEKRGQQLIIYKELKRRELKRKACFNWPKAKQSSYCKTIPNFIIRPLKPGRFVALSGPDILESEKTYADEVGARTVSTYPMLPGLPGMAPQREGDPICDRFNVHLLQNRVVVSVADGCNWGKRPAEAAGNASSSFMRYIRSVQSKLLTTRKAARYLIRAFAQAHDDILFGKKDFYEAGTTTMVGGLLVELDKENFSSDDEDNGESARVQSTLSAKKWGFVCASVGDCKVFHWSPRNKTVVDVTAGNRTNPLNASDCGGRLGPHLEGGQPDLRNFSIFFTTCEVDDILMVMSDGVHDNLDPQTLGKTPFDLNITESKETNWSDLPIEQIDSVKEKYREERLKEMIIECGKAENKQWQPPSPEDIMKKVIDYCVTLTKSSRDFMEQNPGKKLQDDYVNFPGKMDHTTFVAIRVAEIPDIQLMDDDDVQVSTPKLDEFSNPVLSSSMPNIIVTAQPTAPITPSLSASASNITSPAKSSHRNSMRKQLTLALKGKDKSKDKLKEKDGDDKEKTT